MSEKIDNRVTKLETDLKYINKNLEKIDQKLDKIDDNITVLAVDIAAVSSSYKIIKKVVVAVIIAAMAGGFVASNKSDLVSSVIKKPAQQIETIKPE